VPDEGGRVIVVGSVNEDTRLEVDAHVRPGETISARSVATGLGGKGLNQAVAARRAGATTVMVGAVGGDPAGERARRLLDAEQIGASLAMTSGPTGSAIVAVDARGENSIIVVPGANGEVGAATVTAQLPRLASSDVVVLQLELGSAAVRAAIEGARAAGACVILNAAPYRDDAHDLAADVDLLVVNASEASAMSGGDADPRAAAARIARDLGIRVVVTLGAEGSLAIDAETTTDIPARRVAAVDTTAAGDTYVGYLAAGLCRGEDLAASMASATAAAAVTVGRKGAIASIPTRGEI
jgi:ribokinase